MVQMLPEETNDILAEIAGYKEQIEIMHANLHYVCIKNAELKKQIEKMKDCCNCKHEYTRAKCNECELHDLWELG